MSEGLGGFSFLIFVRSHIKATVSSILSFLQQGKPSRPKINMKFSKTLLNNVTITNVRVSLMVSLSVGGKLLDFSLCHSGTQTVKSNLLSLPPRNKITSRLECILL